VVSVVKPVRARTFLATLSALVVLAGMLFGANVASADSVWYQSYQRASQTEACTAQVGETPWQASWGTDSSWYPSWEQWANNGQGAWVCSRSITWAQTPAASSESGACETGGPYAVGSTGPGCGLVFLISGGLTYEMAPNTWGGGIIESAQSWTTTALVCYASGSSTANASCQANNLYPGTTSAQSASSTASRAVGMGSANTAAIEARMTAGSEASSAYAAGMASAYAGGGLTDWFLPSKDELNAMCNYSRTWTGTPPTGACTGAQDGAFAASSYGFSDGYWTSSQVGAAGAWGQDFDNGSPGVGPKNASNFVRPVRAF
jgi:Protein of unknown function (DUF1566)